MLAILMKSNLLTTLFLCVLILLLFNVWFYFLQPGMVFYPYRDLESTPADRGLEYEDVQITTADNIAMHGWYLPAKNSKQVVLFFHGNAGNISHRGDSLEIFHRLGLNVLIIDYRGYGNSQGEVSEQGFYLDAKAAWQYLTEQRGYKAGDIIIFGRSMGGAVATHLASQVQPGALILESTFSSVKDMAAMVMPVISKLIYLRYDFDTENKISQVKSPLLVLHSPGDEVVPYPLGIKVYNAANSPRYFYELHGSHNDGFIESQPGYEQALAAFLEEQ